MPHVHVTVDLGFCLREETDQAEAKLAVKELVDHANSHGLFKDTLEAVECKYIDLEEMAAGESDDDGDGEQADLTEEEMDNAVLAVLKSTFDQLAMADQQKFYDTVFPQGRPVERKEGRAVGVIQTGSKQ